MWGTPALTWATRQSAEIYMDYRGRRYHHRHRFSEFQLFWVDTDQRTKAPAGR